MVQEEPGLHYEPTFYVDRATTERELTSGDERRVVDALLAASLEDDDPSWVFEQCLTLAEDPRPGIRSAVAHAIGHLASPGRFVDPRGMDVLRRLGEDPAVRPAVVDGIADVQQAIAIGRTRRRR